jgi:hypothetical protein
MPEQIVLEPKDPYEWIDVVASSKLKAPHKRFGEYTKRLSAIIKEVVGDQLTKGGWQPWFTIATKVFGLVYRGHTLDVARAVATALASEMDVDAGTAERLAEAIYNRKQEIIGGPRARPTREEGF